MALDEIHESGNVPQCKANRHITLPLILTVDTDREKLHLGVGKFMKRLQVEKPVARENYIFQVVAQATNQPSDGKLVDKDELGWASTMMGEEFPDGQIHTECEPKRKLSVNTVTPEMIVLRTERQTFRRLPKTGAILFTIRTYTTPVVKLAQEPGVPSRLASSVRSWPDSVAE